jgi:hypothetical protein
MEESWTPDEWKMTPSRIILRGVVIRGDPRVATEPLLEIPDTEPAD